jgi:peroxiredoxin 2/4
LRRPDIDVCCINPYLINKKDCLDKCNNCYYSIKIPNFVRRQSGMVRSVYHHPSRAHADKEKDMEDTVTLQIEDLPGLPRLGEPAPAFEAETTMGPIRLEDFQGNWLILFSHPADFTPVCTTEFVAFAQMAEEFRKINVELMGLSIDSVFSHIAWVRNIEANFGVKVTFPVIADLDRKVATLFGMVMPGESKTETSRCVFIIDPKGILRAMIYYPLSTGRNMQEFLRLIRALQTTDAHGVATPANWQPGEPVIVPPPRTQELAEARLAEGFDCKDWYFCKKQL